MRLRPASCAAWLKLLKLRLTPGSVALVVVKALLSPNAAASTLDAAALKVLWPETYSGCGGVISSGRHASSTEVAALLSRSASWMAVSGRHKPKLYLASQQAMAASARATFNWANSRALALRLLPWVVATAWAIWFQWPGGVRLPLPSAQNKACWVWSAVRVLPAATPNCLISLTAVA